MVERRGEVVGDRIRRDREDVLRKEGPWVGLFSVWSDERLKLVCECV